MSAKRIASSVFVAVLLASSCKTNEGMAHFWQKRLKGAEVVELSYEFYNEQFGGEKGGTVWITERTSGGSSEAFYGFSARIQTHRKTQVSVDGSKFELQPGRDTNYQVFKNLTESRYEEFKPMFGKEISMGLSIEGKPISTGTFYAPKPVHIVSPVPDPADRASFDVRDGSEIKWVPDPQHTNGIIINISEVAMPDDKTGNVPRTRIFLTPDDGLLSIKDISRYLPRNGSQFQITLNRYSYKTVAASGKKYRFFASTSESATYRLVP